jgi:hypothetical protein
MEKLSSIILPYGLRWFLLRIEPLI